MASNYVLLLDFLQLHLQQSCAMEVIWKASAMTSHISNHTQCRLMAGKLALFFLQRSSQQKKKYQLEVVDDSVVDVKDCCITTGSTSLKMLILNVLCTLLIMRSITILLIVNYA